MSITSVCDVADEFCVIFVTSVQLHTFVLSVLQEKGRGRLLNTIHFVYVL